MIFSQFCGYFGLFDTLYDPATFGRAKMYQNVPQEQRMWQNNQQVTGNGTEIDPEVDQKGTKLYQNSTKKTLLQSSPSTKSV